MNRLFLIILCFSAAFLHAEDEYKFAGKHFLASYIDCDPSALADLDLLIGTMDDAVRASGATILDKVLYIFSPNAITMAYLLSESHASIHTYPEHGSCFVDLFTCGDHCSYEQFDQSLRDYLKPKTVNARLFSRDENVTEIPMSRLQNSTTQNSGV